VKNPLGRAVTRVVIVTVVKSLRAVVRNPLGRAVTRVVIVAVVKSLRAVVRNPLQAAAKNASLVRRQVVAALQKRMPRPSRGLLQEATL
jgi:hypothetical protein